MKKKSETYITVDRHNQEVEDLLWWIETSDEDEDDFDMSELDDIDCNIQGAGRVQSS